MLPRLASRGAPCGLGWLILVVLFHLFVSHPLHALQQSQTQLAGLNEFAFIDSTTHPSTTVSNDVRKILEDYVAYLASKSKHKATTSVSERKSQTGSHSNTLATVAEEIDPLGKSDSTTNVLYELPSSHGLSVELNDDELTSFIESMLNSAPATTEALNETSDYDEKALMAEDESLLENITTTESPEAGKNETSMSLLTTEIVNVTGSESTTEMLSEVKNTTEMPLATSNTESSITLFNRAELSESVNESMTTMMTTTMPTPTTTSMQDIVGGTFNTSKDEIEVSNTLLDSNSSDDIELIQEIRRTEKILQIQMDLLRHLNETLAGANQTDGTTTTTESCVTSTQVTQVYTTTPSPLLEASTTTESNIETTTTSDLLPTITTTMSSLPKEEMTSTQANLVDVTTNKLNQSSIEFDNEEQSLSVNNVLASLNVTTISSEPSGSEGNDTGEAMILTHVPKITIIHKITKPKEKSGDRGKEDEIYRETLRRSTDLIKTAMASISLYPAAFKRYKITSGPAGNRIDRVGEIYLLPNFSRAARLEDKDSHDLSTNNSNEAIFYKRPVVVIDGNEAVLANDVKHRRSRKIKIAQRKRVHPHRQYVVDNFTTTEKPKASVASMVAESWLEKSEITPQTEASVSTTPVYFNFNRELATPVNLLKIFRARPRRKFRKVKLPTGLRLRKKSTPTPSTTPITILYGVNTTLIPEFLAPKTSTVPSNETATTVATINLLPQNSERFAYRDAPDEPSFKVFCTYDSYRSLSMRSNTSTTQYFDIGELEDSSPILSHCTHLVYAFAAIDLNGDLSAAPIMAGDAPRRTEIELKAEESLTRLIKLKEKLPRLKILAAVGGWSTPPQLLSLLTATSRLRDRLVANIDKFVLRHQFDGAILSWFYPVFGSLKTSSSETIPGRSTRSTVQSLFQLDDRANLVKLMQAIRQRFDSIAANKLELGLMAPPFEELLDRGFDVDHIQGIVDHLILMTYDYFGPWEERVHHFAPLYPSRVDFLHDRWQQLNINHTLNYWTNRKEAPRNKTVLGLAFYGRSFTLANASEGSVGSLSSGPGLAGPITNKQGLLAFNELCDMYLGQPDVKLREDEHHITSSLQFNDQWVGFDDELSLYLKTKYAFANRLGGVFLWSINHDDYRNRCGWGRFPLLKAVYKAVEHCRLMPHQCRV